ncbi:MAG TPA: glycerate kinase [Spirochaetia bacterium]|nr:glycerate kinase [Spirochaetia bacterium]
MDDNDRLRNDALSIFKAGVARVDPRPMVRNALRLEGNRLIVDAAGDPHSWDLGSYDRILVLGYGKAGARMALGAEDVLGEKISAGIVAVKAGYAERCSRVRIIEAAHPVPDDSSVEAARSIIELARTADARTLVIVLVSGGGSAILCAPYDDGTHRISLRDKAAVTKELLASGADIRQMNTVRRHLSAVKGGRLAEVLAPATVVSLILSDVVGDDLSSIASGPTVPDPTSWKDALGIVQRFGIESRIPEAALQLLREGAAGNLPDTPKPGNPAFARVTNIIIGSNRAAALAATEEAKRLGYTTLYLGSRISGEAREIARFYLGLALDCAANGTPLTPPACIIAGGETTVTLRGDGRGGRNQEMALAVLVGMEEAEESLTKRMLFLSAGTDGSDGPTDAAGGFADISVLKRARSLDLSPQEYLRRNDSYHFLDASGGLVKTGPTNTNVCDLQIVLLR